jgi:hypothetical protein
VANAFTNCLLYILASPLQRLAMEPTFFVLRYVRGEGSRDREMATRSQYLNKANDCADAAKKAREPAERVALLQVSQCFILLSDYVAARQEHGSAHRGDEQRSASPDS